MQVVAGAPYGGTISIEIDVAPCFVTAFIKTIRGTSPPGGPYAPNGRVGTYLHWRYSGTLTWGARTAQGDPTAEDYVGEQVVVEFEAPTFFTLPYCGRLELTGGQGDYVWGAARSWPIAPHLYQPMMHTLRQVIVGEGPFSFFVPDYHAYILGYDATTTFTTANGDVISPSFNLPGTPVAPGEELQASKSTTAVTGWWG